MNDLNNFEDFMEAAYSQMFNCDEKIKPKVGAVLVIDKEIVATGYKTKILHAERMAIETAIEKGFNLENSILFTTLEPCIATNENQAKLSCSDFIIQSNIKTVYIGSYDDHPNIYRKGWRNLREAGVTLKDFTDEYRENIIKKNEIFVNFFSKGKGPKSGAKVFHKDGAKFEIQFSNEDTRTIDIQWTLCGKNAAYAYAVPPVTCANALYADSFEDVDNPGVFKGSSSARIGLGEIGVFKSPDAYVLVRPKDIQSGPDYGDNEFYVTFDYEVRIRG